MLHLYSIFSSDIVLCLAVNEMFVAQLLTMLTFGAFRWELMTERGKGSDHEHWKSCNISYYRKSWYANRFAEKLWIWIQNGCNGTTSVTLWAASVSWQFPSNILGLALWIQEDNMITITQHEVWHCNKAWVQCRLGTGVSLTLLSGLWVIPMGVLTATVVGFDELDVFTKSKIATGWESQGTRFCLEGKKQKKKRLIYEVPGDMSAAKLETMQNQSWTHSALKRTLKSILPSMCNSWCVAVRKFGIFWWWMRLFHSRDQNDLLAKVTQAQL